MCVTMKQKSPLKLMENSHHQKPSKPPDRDDEFQTSETPLRPSYRDRALWRVTEQEEYKTTEHCMDINTLVDIIETLITKNCNP